MSSIKPEQSNKEESLFKASHPSAQADDKDMPTVALGSPFRVGDCKIKHGSESLNFPRTL